MKATMKTPVRLREKSLKNGNKSLYLDIYKGDGRRDYEFLKLYLIANPRTPLEREQNRETLLTAEAIRSKRQIEVQNGEYGFASRFKSDTLFLEYFRAYRDKRKESTKRLLSSCLTHLEKYFTEQTTFKDITPDKVTGFKNYLNIDAFNGRTKNIVPLSEGSKNVYFNIFTSCLNEAYRENVIPNNPAQGIKGIKKPETKREYLTIDELKKMAETECKHPELKRAFLFSCLTGLRVCDILALTWGNVHQTGGHTRIEFKQKKTGGQEYLDVSKQAEQYFGKRGGDTERVFANFYYNNSINQHLREWARQSGINKHITFHSGRHTFATLELTYGVDIYTLSKLLGHRELSTTQIYAKVIDQKKREAVNLIPDIHY